ncbi:hypothetical protein Q6D67_06320 [Haliea sp. E1-2-M8]|uniref:hypothetical protein n=1 Tax=Haliea sp. E1-2-M8 TaxID=3064706 RepID=UPI002721F194|nr:hypothetical protein [Haliea sp. E1-2-M8]MDO8861312.1 hypothetical protein [Haliea sp. E1-2-M8]
MYQPVDFFSVLDWIYIGEGPGDHYGEAWGSNKLILESACGYRSISSTVTRGDALTL